jgi:UDP-glucose 4-epimerase
MNILLTGGTGYIGSHTAVAMMRAGHNVVLLDNLSNSSKEVVHRLEKILGTSPHFVQGDIRDIPLVVKTLKEYEIQSVVHFAGLKAVGESTQKPVAYYDNNVGGTICLLQAMQQAGVKSLIFSSSATVYGVPRYLPLDESHPTSSTNPYGNTKILIEMLLQDLSASDPTWRIVNLRYFNPVGAHESGLIGENPNGIPNNLMPYITRVACGALDHLTIHGNDYPTPDGTGVRDFIHVMDLAEGHLAAVDFLVKTNEAFSVFNLGTGRGYSVLEVVEAFQAASGRPVPYRIGARRNGDVACCYADPAKAERDLHWKATRDLREMCVSAWRYQASLA